ncbi:expressed unknown protein [Seminavis robusta]|uniref:BTB domain-containing protein n=1 Tax=Seminavis robusta TaxID=568900 RepID=A0A9N8HP62_9STRA|nr:expressed unknown protein [Seminavis robusta]|eukprot:Sro1058_g236330.1 n/a (211) ;mRNA; f:4881-5513
MMWELNKTLFDQKPPAKPPARPLAVPGGAKPENVPVAPGVGGPQQLLMAPDVKILASHGASPRAEVEWSREAHKSLLCAHSEYFRSLLTHDGGSFDTDLVDEASTSDNKAEQAKVERIILRLDSSQFTEETMRLLLSYCYGRSLHGTSVENLLELVDGAAYMGMTSFSLRFEESLVAKLKSENVAQCIHLPRNTEQSDSPWDATSIYVRT